LALGPSAINNSLAGFRRAIASKTRRVGSGRLKMQNAIGVANVMNMPGLKSQP
jgi:hypothetical protein